MDIKSISNSALGMFISGFMLFYMEPIMPLGDARWLVLACIGVIIFVIINRKDLFSAVKWKKKKQPSVVGVLEAQAIIGMYLQPSLHGNSRAILIKRQFLDNFEKTTGAKLGEYQYNAELLHEWMQSNAARFLIEHQKDMR